jgi:hypothetical protein
MPETRYRGRRAAAIENSRVRLTVLVEGGHIAELLDKRTGVNPLWTPPWPSIEPSAYDPVRHPEYGAGAESKLLAGIMGHNLCLDIFGGVSAEEAAAGLTVHGEASVAEYSVQSGEALTLSARFPISQLAFMRELRLHDCAVEIVETVENLAGADRPIGWTQHVTLGPPFLEKGRTHFRASATRSKVYETDFTGANDYMKPAAEFDWPHVTLLHGGTADLRVFADLPVSGGYTAHLMDQSSEHAFFTAWSPTIRLAMGYLWRRADFPWMGIWEENYSRTQPPWNGTTLTRGMEFGVSPMPETRRQMIERGSLFGVPAFRWIPARSTAEARYWALIEPRLTSPEAIELAGGLPAFR